MKKEEHELDKIYTVLNEMFPKGFIVAAVYDEISMSGEFTPNQTFYASNGNISTCLGLCATLNKWLWKREDENPIEGYEE
jgi:hypothetical protein